MGGIGATEMNKTVSVLKDCRLIEERQMNK